MSSFTNPVGPNPPEVYWRRRAWVLAGLIVVVVLVVMVVSRLSSSPADPVAPPPVSPSAEADAPVPPSAAPEQSDGAPCLPGSVRVEARTDKDVYAAGEKPLLSLSVTNVGTVACVLSVGTAQQLFEVSSGSDVWWRSSDCQENPVEAEQVLEPGVALDSAQIPWDRSRSGPDTCGGERPAAPAGGASYHLTVTIGGVSSAESKQFLLG